MCVAQFKHKAHRFRVNRFFGSDRGEHTADQSSETLAVSPDLILPLVHLSAARLLCCAAVDMAAVVPDCALLEVILFYFLLTTSSSSSSATFFKQQIAKRR